MPRLARRPAAGSRLRRHFLAALLLVLLGLLAAPSTTMAADPSRYAASVAADSPTAYWRLGEASGTAAADETGRYGASYRGAPALGQAPLIASDGNPAAGFDARDDWVRSASAAKVNPSKALTVEAWINARALPASGRSATILGKGVSWALRFDGSVLRFSVRTSSGAHVLSAPAGSIRVGRRYHVAASYDGVRQRLYVNGRQVASRSQTGGIVASGSAIAVASSGVGHYFAGTVDEVAVYTHRVPDAHIAKHAIIGRVGDDAIRTGMATHFMWQPLADTVADLDRMKAARMELARFDFSWANSEPTKGSRLYFDKLDSVLEEIGKRGMRAVVTVLETPAWANGGAGTMAPPSDPGDYARFIGDLAQHMAARPNMTWEIWNEPNDSHFWTTGPNAARYTALLKAAYVSVKANDPDAIVLGGSILFNDTGFLRGMYAAGAKGSFDGLSIHPYCKAYAPASTTDPYFSFRGSVPAFTGVLSANGEPSKPIWITEMGWSTAKVSDATRATYLRDATTIARGWTNVRGMAAYTLHQSQYAAYGLLTTSGTATRSWSAYVAAQ